tara:strand:- start:131 stop:853 length:723 start_codon:yes stop_codon:yes gene_type:complete
MTPRQRAKLMSAQSDLLHKLLEHYLHIRYNRMCKDPVKQAKSFLTDAVAQNEYHVAIVREAGYTPNEIKAWAMKNLRWFVGWFEKQNFVWWREELDLQAPANMCPDGMEFWVAFGKPDFVGRQQDGTYVVVDFKTTAATKDNLNYSGSKLASYAEGLRRWIHRNEGRDVFHYRVMFMVFRPLKVKKGSIKKPTDVVRKRGVAFIWKERHIDIRDYRVDFVAKPQMNLMRKDPPTNPNQPS